jgi:hypothetical protein
LSRGVASVAGEEGVFVTTLGVMGWDNFREGSAWNDQRCSVEVTSCMHGVLEPGSLRLPTLHLEWWKNCQYNAYRMMNAFELCRTLSQHVVTNTDWM